MNMFEHRLCIRHYLLLSPGNMVEPWTSSVLPRINSHCVQGTMSTQRETRHSPHPSLWPSFGDRFFTYKAWSVCVYSIQ